jgi:predicted kinase
MVVIVFGLPGSGKSFFSSKLAKVIDAIHLSSDQVRSTMFNSRTYTSDEKETVYKEMLSQAEQHVRSNKDVIIDATFYRQQLRNKFRQALEPFTKVCFIEIVANERLTEQRINKPRRFSEADYDVYLKIKSLWEPLNEEHLLIESTENNINAMLEQSQRYLNDKK